MKPTIKTSEKGQAIVLIVVSIFVMFAMAALIVDGGNLYLNRRQAQTAADAAALAGANERCAHNGTLAAVTDVVNEYATVQNTATAVESLTVAGDRVEVVVSLTAPTFFAKVLGIQAERVQASASADCLIPGGIKGNLVPIAWTCRPPVGGQVGDCEVERIPRDVFEEIKKSGFDFDSLILDVGDEKTALSYQTDLDGLFDEGKALYIVMDTDQFNENTDCQMYGGPVDCDFNNDGVIDIAAGGDRGWLYLEGNAADLDDIMRRGTEGEIPVNKWMPGKPGSDDVVIKTAHDYKVGEVVFIPAFDKLCQTNDFFNDPACDYNSPPDTIWEWKGEYTYYHITDFMAFYITCVYSNPQDSCPGRDHAGLGKNDADTIEGYFLDDVITAGTPGNGQDVGVYIVSLTN